VTLALSAEQKCALSCVSHATEQGSRADVHASAAADRAWQLNVPISALTAGGLDERPARHRQPKQQPFAGCGGCAISWVDRRSDDDICCNGSSATMMPPGMLYQDQSQKPLRAEEASRAYGRRAAAALFSARANQGSVRCGAGSIHRSFRLALRIVFCSFFVAGRPDSAWSAAGSSRAAPEAEFSSIGLETGGVAAEFSVAIAAEGALGRPTAMRAMAGASVNARTRTRRGLKNEHPRSSPGVAPGHIAFRPGLASTAKADARPPSAKPALVVPFCPRRSTRGLDSSAALVPASDIATAVAVPGPV
jgi:hypothetical protein